MPKKKHIPIDYTSRDFSRIKDDLIAHAKRYYPNVYKDFSDASFGSFLLETVSYVGDVLSFYADFQANESFMDTAVELGNIRRHATTLGYKYADTAGAYGVITVYIVIPSNVDGSAPDWDYAPILKKGSIFRGSSINYMLTEDIDFAKRGNDMVAAKFDGTTGNTTYYAIRSYGQIKSGFISNFSIDLSNETTQRYRRERLGNNNITEVISCLDDNGNEWYEVDNLTQEVVYKETTNPNAQSDGVRSILKPIVAARRFVFDQDETGTYVQFGFGDENYKQLTGLVDPAKVAIKMHGKNNITNVSFDPNEMLSTGKLGVSPSGKRLLFKCRTNYPNFTGSPANSVNTVQQANLEFKNRMKLNEDEINTIQASLECTNKEPIVGKGRTDTSAEIKVRAKANYARQNRAITAHDYESLVYQMPTPFGSVAKCAILSNSASKNNEISLYVVSMNNSGHLTATPSVTKNNIKKWLTNYKPLNDVIVIKDAKVVNFGIEFQAVADSTYDSANVMTNIREEIEDYFSIPLDVGEPIYLSPLWSLINKIKGVVDVKRLKIYNRTGGRYSENYLNFDDIMSNDGTYVKTPKNVIMELKYVSEDIKGVIK